MSMSFQWLYYVTLNLLNGLPDPKGSIITLEVIVALTLIKKLRALTNPTAQLSSQKLASLLLSISTFFKQAEEDYEL